MSFGLLLSFLYEDLREDYKSRVLGHNLEDLRPFTYRAGRDIEDAVNTLLNLIVGQIILLTCFL